MIGLPRRVVDSCDTVDRWMGIRLSPLCQLTCLLDRCDAVLWLVVFQARLIKDICRVARRGQQVYALAVGSRVVRSIRYDVNFSRPIG